MNISWVKSGGWAVIATKLAYLFIVTAAESCRSITDFNPGRLEQSLPFRARKAKNRIFDVAHKIVRAILVCPWVLLEILN